MTTTMSLSGEVMPKAARRGARRRPMPHTSPSSILAKAAVWLASSGR